jgi:hypothetical protein
MFVLLNLSIKSAKITKSISGINCLKYVLNLYSLFVPISGKSVNPSFDNTSFILLLAGADITHG